MFGIEMLFKAIGLDDAALADLRAMIDPAHLKTQIQAARDEYAKVRADLDEIKSLLRDLRAHQGLTEIVAHGGQVLHPNFQKNLDDALIAGAERGDVAFVIEAEVDTDRLGKYTPRTTQDRLAIEAERPLLDNAEPLDVPDWIKHLRKGPENDGRDNSEPASAGSDGSGSGSGG
jgi:hypothetical protein